ncbi:glycosyltransferase [Paenibacillus gansuensis]|uniref:Glycosyltransferase n=1 Tax=Paenibacillus gansuensis TaxID=306542 RepID=A0ABW5PCP4_9BACL
MESVLWVISGLLAVQLAFVLWNTSQFPRIPPGSKELPDAEGAPLRLSILIPARDEERNIEACLYSIVEQNTAGLKYEVIVLNDRSSDGTGRLAENIASRYPQVRVLHGAEPPGGWTGKSYACHQLAEAAGGNWLFFMDADARLEPGAVAALLQFAEGQGNGVVTGFPRQETHSWMERLVVPMMMYTISCHLPVKLVRGTNDPRFAAAHGAALLLHRDTYGAVGGHAAIAGELVDDMALVRRAKLAGHPVTLAEMHPWVTMRMYRSGSEVWNGYKKNVFPGVGRNPFIMAGVLAWYGSLYVIPAVSMLLSWAAPHWLLPSVICCLLAMLTKLRSDRVNGLPWIYAPGIALSAGLLVSIGLDSWYSSGAGRGYTWKGRRYL